MIVLIHGLAELLRAEALVELAASCGDDPDLVELNTTRLDGRTISPAELENACGTLPFLTGKRLVVVEGLLARFAAPSKTKKAGEAAAEGYDEEPAVEAPGSHSRAILAYLDHVPPTTLLVLIEEDMASGPVLRELQEMSRHARAKIITCERPKRNDLPNWIRARAQKRNVKLDAGAVMDLAEFVGDELRQLDQELIKFGDYAGGRTVTREDVRKLTPATRAASVFELVDALGAGNGPVAGRLLTHALGIDGEPPLRLLGMIARHYRQLIQLKALQAQGMRNAEIARTLGIFEWKVPGLVNQANRHSFARLEQAMERILAADESIKTGKTTDREAMDVLLAELMPS